MAISVYIETLGCAKNRVDSEIMLGTLLNDQFEYSPSLEEAEVIIVNTCGFLTSAVNESIERILALAEMKEQGVCRKLIVAGCMVERYRDQLLTEMPEVDAIIGTSDYTEILACVNNALEGGTAKIHLGQKPAYASANTEANRILSTQYYAYLKVAEGCSNHCTFCNIPRLRGKLISRPSLGILAEFNQLLASGIKEINLISQDCSAYGNDLAPDDNLYHLVRQLLDASKQEFWLRIFYTYPNQYPVELFQLMKADPRLVPYVDIPFQHISDSVLKAMNRRIMADEMERLVETALHTLDQVALRTTLMVGFPTETEADFLQLLKFVEKGYFHHLGVFTYSHEDNIASAKLGDRIPEDVKTARRDALMEAQQKISLEKNQSMVGQIQKVLVEGTYEETDLLLKGRTRFQGADVDGVVLINDGFAEAGEFSQIKITEAYPYDLVGEAR